MCFLACLTAGAVYMMNQSASAWMRDIASEVTVQIEAKQRVDMDKVVADVARFLSQRTGIAAVRPLSVADSAQLLVGTAAANTRENANVEARIAHTTILGSGSRRV